MSLFNLQFNTHLRAGGPRFNREQFDLDRGTDDFSGGGGHINVDPIGALPKPIPTPRSNAELLANGLTLADLDRAARFETEEGVPIGIFYGRVLFALKLVSHLYEPGPGAGLPRNTFTGILGEGRGGLGDRGEWHRIVAAYYAGQALTKRYDFTIWFEDRLPKGAVPNVGEDGWNWVATNPAPYTGKYSHQSPLKAGTHQHFFTAATQTLAIGTGDIISCWVFLDPTNPPTEVMLQFALPGDFEHRAFWGADSIPFGVLGTNSRRQISASVPPTGQWYRLDVPANLVGLEGTSIEGMAFTLFGGAATWGRVMRSKNDMGGGNTGYVFRPGRIAPDINDLVQVQDINTWPSGLGYNGSAAVTVRLDTTQSAQDRPDAVKVIAECRLTPNYDATGAEIIDQYGYSASPARAAADRFLYFFQRRFRDRLDIAHDRFRKRIFWPSWTGWRDNSAALIPWDREGDAVNVFVPRAEFHGGWTGKVTMAQVLDDTCGQSFTGWQDDGEKIIFLPATWPPPISHHFHPGNIVRAPQRSTKKLGSQTNRFIGKLRDVEGQFNEPAAVEPPRDTDRERLREESINRVGEIPAEYQLVGMSQSQAYRLMEQTARLEHDNPTMVNLVGNATSIHLIPWDFVTVSHSVLGWDHQICLVRSATVRSAESSADECEFTLQKIDGAIYDDAAHGPRQTPLELEP